MRIVSIDVFEKTYPLVDGPFTMSGGRVTYEQDSTIVRVETNDGIVGWGEQCAFSPNYLVGHGAGARAAMPLLAPALLGLDPRQTGVVYDRMNSVLRGHSYAKAALDIACWDILGKSTGLRVSDLLGGTFQERFPLYVGIGIDSPEIMAGKCLEMAERGYRRFQIKVGTDWRSDVTRVMACVDALPEAEKVIIDANGYWSQQEAVQAIARLDELDIYLEQPCRTTNECAQVRQRSRRPFILDESISDPEDILLARDLGAMDAAVLKLSRFGGITPIRRARDLCITCGLSMTIEDSGGGDIVTAAMAHLTASVPKPYSMHGFLVNGMVDGNIAEGGPVPEDGFASLPDGPGLGISVDEAALGPRLARFE